MRKIRNIMVGRGTERQGSWRAEEFLFIVYTILSTIYWEKMQM